MSSRERVPPRRNDSPNGRGAGTSGISDVPPGAGAAPPKRPPPWDRPEAESTSFGEWLRRQREMREITLRDIADRTKISMRYLQAMEDNRFDLLPAPIFAKGFLREYARYVGLSPDEVVNHYLSVQQQALGDEEAKRDQTLSHQKPHRPKPVRSWTYGIFLAISVLVLVGLVALFAWIADRRRDRPEGDGTPPAIAAPPQLSPVPFSPPPTSNRPQAPLEVTLDFTGTCWVEVTVDGKLFVAEERVQGESLPVEAQQSVQIKLGDTGAAEIQVNGLLYPLNGQPGEVRELTIDLETVRRLQEKKEAP